MWRLWAKALGDKYVKDNKEADTIALIRTGIVLCYIITNLFIIAGVIRHWQLTNVKISGIMMTMEIKMYSELELLVMKDMMELDFDPLNVYDIQLYWERILG